MNNKKGFTLIELIAAIVILAIILLIAVPKVLTTINTSRKNTLVSSTKIIANVMQSDSTLSKEYNYKLSSLGKLYRCNDGIDCNNTTEIKYNGKLVSFSDYAIVIKNADGNIELVNGTICEKTKKYCFQGTNESPISLRKVNLSLVKDSNLITNENNITTTNGTDIIASGDISNFGDGSITYELNRSGVLTINGMGATKSSDSDGSPYNRISAKIVRELMYNDLDIENINLHNEEFQLTTEELISFGSAYFSYIYASPETQIENFVDWFYYEYGFYPGFVSQNTSDKGVAIEDYQFLFSFFFGEENINKSFNYTKTNSLIIGNGITEIGDNCFKALGINSVIIPQTVSTINSGAFANNFLESVTLPSSVSLVKYNAFSYNHLERLNIHSGELLLENDSFCGNPKLVNPEFSSKTTQSGSFHNPNLLGGGCKSWDF